jgi:hypothetical protein
MFRALVFHGVWLGSERRRQQTQWRAWDGGAVAEGVRLAASGGRGAPASNYDHGRERAG